MHLRGNYTTQDTCAYTEKIIKEVEPTGRCGIHYRAPAEQTDVFFYYLFYFDKINLGSYISILSVDLMRFQTLLICIKMVRTY